MRRPPKGSTGPSLFDFPTGHPDTEGAGGPDDGERSPAEQDSAERHSDPQEHSEQRSLAHAREVGQEEAPPQHDLFDTSELPVQPRSASGHGETLGSQQSPSYEDPLYEPALASAAHPDGREGYAGEEDVHGFEGPRAAGIGGRLAAGLADLLMHSLALAVAMLSMLFFDLQPALELWPGFAVFGIAFSFLYVTVPLAFWGRTAGMAWQGLRTTDAEGLPLTYSQTALRWLASIFTVALAGLPLLLALSGRSLADRLSSTETHQHR